MDFPQETAIFKDFQGLEFLFLISRTFKVRANPVVQKIYWKCATAPLSQRDTFQIVTYFFASPCFPNVPMIWQPGTLLCKYKNLQFNYFIYKAIINL